MFIQDTLFADTELYTPASESLEALLADWDVREDGTLIRRLPEPFTPACLAENEGRYVAY